MWYVVAKVATHHNCVACRVCNSTLRPKMVYVSWLICEDQALAVSAFSVKGSIEGHIYGFLLLVEIRKLYRCAPLVYFDNRPSRNLTVFPPFVPSLSCWLIEIYFNHFCCEPNNSLNCRRISKS